MKILLTSALLLASVIGALAQETPPDTGGGRFSAERMLHQKQAAQAQAQQKTQQPASVQDQLTSVYSTLNVNLAHQLDMANAEIAGLKAKLDAANSPPVNDITKEK